jgi:threonyl-tRNA synthetase
MHPSSLSPARSRSRLAAEVLAYAVWCLFPPVVLGGGGTHSLGFFYDFLFDQPLTPHLLDLIEMRLRTIIKEELDIRFLSMMRENAQTLFEHHHQPLLAEQIGEERANIVELIQIGEFYGICPELPLASTLDAGSVKLLESSTDHKGSYQSFIRLVGTSQPTPKELKVFCKNYASLIKRKDHRQLGPQLNLFSFFPQISALGIFWHPKGLLMRQILQQWVTQQGREGIDNIIRTPWVVKEAFLPNNSKNLESFEFDGEPYRLSASPFPQHVAWLNSRAISASELPIRFTEEAPIYQDYPDSQQWGLFCTCHATVDQTTIYCEKEQILSELISSLHLIEQIIKIFDFEAQWFLVTSLIKRSQVKDQLEVSWLKQALERRLNPCFPVVERWEEQEKREMPSLELRVRDVIGREWPTSALTVRVTDRVILSRRMFGSLERFIALLIEHYEGNFPLWLAPEQVRLLVIGEANIPYAEQVMRSLAQKNLRVKLEGHLVKWKDRIIAAEKERVPYLVLIGDQERVHQKVRVRTFDRRHQDMLMTLEVFIEQIYQKSLCPVLITQHCG